MWAQSKATIENLEFAIELAATKGEVQLAAPFSDAVMTLLFAITKSSPDVPKSLIEATRLAFSQDN